MHLSQQTIAVLRPLAKINPGIVIGPGNVLSTRTPEIIAEATVAETFPHEARIFNIHEFIRRGSFFTDPIYEFGSDHVRIVESDRTAETLYAYAHPNLMASPRTRNAKPLPNEKISLTIGEAQWATLTKVLGVGIQKKNEYSGRQLKIRSDGTKVCLLVECGRKTEFSMSVAVPTNGYECEIVLDAANLALMPGPYELAVFPSFVEFRHSGEYNLVYYVAADPLVSSWGGTQVYEVKVTKSLSQELKVNVNAHSPEEAEALVRKTASTLEWIGDPRQHVECKAVVSCN